MNNINTYEISVKEYAENRGKTVQAVYQQMKRKENAEALKGHVKLKWIGNKNVKYLDEIAVAILDKASNSAPITFLRYEKEEELQAVKQQLEALKQANMKLQGRNELLQEQLAEKDKRLLLLESEKGEIEDKNKEIKILEGYIQDAKDEIEVQKAEKADLRASNEKKDELLLKAEKTAQELSEKLTALEKENEAMKTASFWQRIKGWKK